MADEKTTPKANNPASDDFDEILKELETLKEGLDQADVAPMAAASSDPVVVAEPVKDPVAEPSVEAVQAAVASVEDFHASQDDSSMEEMLAGLKDDVVAATTDSLRSVVVEEAPIPSGPAADSAVTTAPVMVSEPVKPTLRVVNTEPAYSTAPAPVTSETGNGSLTLTVAGNMKLTLKYQGEGQEVTVCFADQSFQVTLADGTEFRVPTARKSAKAA